MTDKIMIPWVINEDRFMLARRAFDYLEEKNDNLELKVIRTADEATKELTQTKYPLIIIHHQYIYKGEVNGRSPLSGRVISSDVIEKIRKEGSANKDTPIILTHVDGEGRNFGDNADEVLKKMGVNQYWNVVEDDSYQKLGDIIRDCLK